MCGYLPACSYSVHDKGWEFLRVKDQTQVAVVSLLNIAASAVRMGPQYAAAFMDGAAMAICKHYKDPYTLVVRWRCGGECAVCWLTTATTVSCL